MTPLRFRAVNYEGDVESRGPIAAGDESMEGLQRPCFSFFVVTLWIPIDQQEAWAGSLSAFPIKALDARILVTYTICRTEAAFASEPAASLSPLLFLLSGSISVVVPLLIIERRLSITALYSKMSGPQVGKHVATILTPSSIVSQNHEKLWACSLSDRVMPATDLSFRYQRWCERVS